MTARLPGAFNRAIDGPTYLVVPYSESDSISDDRGHHRGTTQPRLEALNSVRSASAPGVNTTNDASIQRIVACQPLLKAELGLQAVKCLLGSFAGAPGLG